MSSRRDADAPRRRSTVGAPLGRRPGPTPSKSSPEPVLSFRPSPAHLAYAPPAYPSHDYRGEGEIFTIRCLGEVVGHLTRKDRDWAAIGWLPRPGLSEDAGTVRFMVEDILRRFARDGRPMVDALAEILNKTQHDRPATGPLDAFRHPLADDDAR